MNKETAMPATQPASEKRHQPGTEAPLPWWRFKIVWLVFGLPATVVVASLVTGGIAWTHVDPIVSDPRFSHSNAAEDVAEHGQAKNPLEPAMTARNHAATPGR
jgi:hypothetical protein